MCYTFQREKKGLQNAENSAFTGKEGKGILVYGAAALLDAHRGENIVIGTHGTALCTILHHYDPAFGYEDFIRIRNIMPWIVRLEFDDTGNFVHIRYDPENKP